MGKPLRGRNRWYVESAPEFLVFEHILAYTASLSLSVYFLIVDNLGYRRCMNHPATSGILSVWHVITSRQPFFLVSNLEFSSRAFPEYRRTVPGSSLFVHRSPLDHSRGYHRAPLAIREAAGSVAAQVLHARHPSPGSQARDMRAQRQRRTQGTCRKS